ncbi:nuclear transport factor 2 family protein [Rhodococcus sp. ACS1]|uniref:nuclear transport factor 2 family protein n=1 Tax=Rhodococcus sp. ACS1 TaxID=2028570 RepID=UPI0015C70158|nr:nuclear transport factor 2 family protein [Rhodococcus sp. ACS1]
MTDISSKSIEQISRRWVDLFKDRDGIAFAAQYSDTGEYIDHAFQLRRKGRESIALHIDIWSNSIPNFEMKIAKIDVVGSRSMFSFVGSGTFEKDLPTMAATGTTFSYRGFIVLSVNEQGLITRTEEFYSTSFPNGIPFEDYNFRGSSAPLVR